jgi:hypothetical protein
MLSAPYALPGDGAQGRQAVLILSPLPGTRREFAFIEVGTEPSSATASPLTRA